jgi:predicted oxidoreductase
MSAPTIDRTMNTQSIGTSPLVCSRLAYGCMRYAGTWVPADVTPERQAHGRRCIFTAYDAGYTLFDHADIYCRGMCETIFGQALAEKPAMRDKILIATKCGIRFPGDPEPTSPQRYDFSAEHILRSADKSLKRLNTDRIDIYQLHRPDLLMNPAEVAEAFDKLQKAGKVRYFGVSNFLPSFLSALAAHCPMPLIVNQVEIHLGRLDCFYDGTLDQCLEKTITPLSWSPLGGGMLGDGKSVDPKHPRHDDLTKLLALMDQIAGEHGVSRTVIACAWLMKHPTRIIPIVGSANPDHIRAAVKADDIELSREDWYRLLVAARGKALP